MTTTSAGRTILLVTRPNGLQRVDDIVNIVNQYFHDCS
jgi:hypothetical protein